MEKEAYECGKWQERQQRQERQQLWHLFYFYYEKERGKRALRCSTWYIVKINFEISRKTFL